MSGRRLSVVLCFILSLTVFGCLAHVFDVSLLSPTSPGSGVPGVTQIDLTGTGFPTGQLDPHNVTITLTPTQATSGPTASTSPIAVTRIKQHTRRFTFVIPTSIAVDHPTDYQVQIAGKYVDGRAFDSDKAASLTIEPGSAPPTLSSVSPNAGQSEQSLTVTIAGSLTHFVPGTTQVSFGAGISVGGAATGAFGPVTVNDATHATAQLAIDVAATAGPRTVTVQTGAEEVSLVNGFTVVVPIPLPVADAGGPYSGNVGQALSFDGSHSTGPAGQTLTYAWNFGDSSTGTGVTPTHAYNAPGTFTVSLTVTDSSGGTNTATTTATVTVTVTVPNVVGLTQAAATAALTAANLTVGTVTQQTSATVPAGHIMSQAPAAGASVAPGSPVNFVVSQGQGLPPDPSTVAPPLDTTVATTIGRATAFLYSGANPIQTGVAPTTIVPTRAAVVRGRVLDTTNAPFPGVTITVLQHPEFGQTLSRADGMFDLAVNGGGPLTLTYTKTGFLSAQQQVPVPWQDFAFAPDVILLPPDTQVTTVNLSSSAPMQVARGSVITDSDGTRQATLFFPQGTQAQMVMPDSSTQPLSTLSVRATEFTVGPNGPKAMPAELPPTSGYTYAVDFSADEAQAAGARRVQFAHPIPVYVETSSTFPLALRCPSGAMRRTRGLGCPPTVDAWSKS